jgi:Transglutaminase-like superfamily
VSRWSSKLASSRALLAGVKGPRDVLLILRILAVAMAVPVLMRSPLPRVGALLEPRHVPLRSTPAQESRIVQFVLAVLRAGRPLVRKGCLTRGITLYYFLRRAGADVSLCFGLGAGSEHADGFDGHCWLVRNGQPYLEARDPRPLYTPMYAFPWVPRSEGGA